jgi:hypothetical protein
MVVSMALNDLTETPFQRVNIVQVFFPDEMQNRILTYTFSTIDLDPF